MTTPGRQLHRLLRGVESADALDAAARPLAHGARRRLTRPRLGDALTGTWLGHAVHPVLTDFADGAWMAASFLDVFGPYAARDASQRLVGFGLLAAVPTALTGLAEWVDTTGRRRRVGLLHAVTSSAAFGLYASSYLARRRNQHARAVALGVIGGVVATLDGYIGGHLTLALGVGVAQTAFSELPAGWVAVATAAELTDGQPTPASAGSTDILLVRRGDTVFALANRCTYRGGNLHEGDVLGETVVCPRDGCTFRLSDGTVVTGPASVPQPSLDVRVVAGQVEVRSRTAGSAMSSGGG